MKLKKILIGFLNLILILNCLSGFAGAASVAVLITATAPEGVYGNNFYKDNPPQFSVKIKNASLVSGFSGTFYYNVTKKDGTVIVENSEPESIEIEAKGSVTKDVKIEKEYYGRLNLNITVESDGATKTQIIPYTMSNNERANPSNKMFGVAAHLAINKRGDYKKALPLIKGAGIGTLRDDSFAWSNVETVKGEYNFTDEMDNYLDMMDENELFFIYLWANGNYALYPDENLANNPEWQYLFPTTSEGLNALSNYMEALVEFADGRIDVIEVWNEYNNMSGPYKKQYEYMVDYHKAVYKGVIEAKRKGAKGVTVSGIDTDAWGVFVHGEVEEFLSLLDGEKVFDAVSLHPYNNLNDFNDDPPETGITKSIVEESKRLLEKYGQNPDVDFYFTESGWGDYLFGYDREMQAAYNLRHQAKIQAEGLASASCLYVLFDYGTEGLENTFGILESYDASDAEVPYLGKESYPAIAYYNNLMTDAEFVEIIKTENDENVLIYHFKDRLSRDVLMLSTVDNTRTSITLNLGTDSCIVSDMYGNEESKIMPTESINISVSGIPQYIICDNLDSTPDSSLHQDIYGIVSGKTESNKNIVMNVYNDGFTPENTTSENVGEAFYYTEQKKTDENGNFSFSFPLDEDFKSKNAYIYIDGEQIPRIYKIESWGDFALSYESFPDAKESNHEFFAYLSGRTSEVDKIELVSAGYSAENRLMGMNVAENQQQDSDLFIKKIELDLDLPKSKLMIVSDFYTLKPLTPSINLR